MSKPWFIVLLALSALIVFCLPFDAKLAPTIVSAMTTDARVSITGNSVLSHHSKCDADTRTIAGMLSAELGQPVLDLSYSGQALSESANLADLSLRDPHTRSVVMAVSVFALVDWDDVPFRGYVVFRLLNPSLYAETLRARFTSPDWFSRERTPITLPYVYAGVQYPDYSEIKRRFLRVEQAEMACPETDGHDMRFIASLYYHQYFELPVLQQNVRLLANVGSHARHLGKHLQIVLMPIDYALIQRLLPNEVTALRDRVAGLTLTLKDSGLNVADLTTVTPNHEFVDRWCACGHLGDTGRMSVATQTSRVLIERLPPMAARR